MTDKNNLVGIYVNGKSTLCNTNCLHYFDEKCNNTDIFTIDSGAGALCLSCKLEETKEKKEYEVLFQVITRETYRTIIEMEDPSSEKIIDTIYKLDLVEEEPEDTSENRDVLSYWITKGKK